MNLFTEVNSSLNWISSSDHMTIDLLDLDLLAINLLFHIWTIFSLAYNSEDFSCMILIFFPKYIASFKL